jgi:hypothetical protein
MEPVTWNYDDTDTMLIGPSQKLTIPHKGEHHVAQYKGHKLRILRVVKPLYPDEAHSELVQSWQGEVDGKPVDGMTADHSNPIADALVAHVDALA